jgi:hypothetical protein
LLTVSCWFYTLFLFDTLGDAVGFSKAYWVLIVFPVLPMVLYIFRVDNISFFVGKCAAMCASPQVGSSCRNCVSGSSMVPGTGSSTNVNATTTCTSSMSSCRQSHDDDCEM